MIAKIGAAVLALLCGGCAVRQAVPQTYRLIPGPSLVPPGVAGTAVTMRTFAAQVATGMGSCGAGTDAAGLKLRGAKLIVTVHRDALAGKKPGWLSEWTAGLEADGCLASGEARKLADQIADAVALDPTVSLRLRYASAVEITPRIRIEVVSPLVAAGNVFGGADALPTRVSAAGNGLQIEMRAPDSLLGYETAWYSVTQKQGSPGFRIAPLAAERHIKGETERREAPETDYFRFAADAGFFRLFYKEQQTAFTALVLAGASRAELEDRVRALEGKASCAAVPEGYCVAIPKLSAVNLFLPVTVNDKEIMVRLGAKVGDAIREAGEKRPEAVLSKLTVMKNYQGASAAVEFDRGGRGILELGLVGGERISW